MTTTTWVAILGGFLMGVACVGLVHLLAAIFRRTDKDRPFCRRCGFCRTGIDTQASCPECGASATGRNVMMGRRLANRRRLKLGVAMLLAGTLIPLGLLVANAYSLRVPDQFARAVETGDAKRVKTLTHWFPELADGRYRFAPYTAPPPLAVAYETGHKKVVDRLLVAGADPNVPTTTQRSLLAAAIEANDLVMAEKLLNAGANPDAPAFVENEYLLVPRVITNQRILVYPQTALMLSIRGKNLDATRMLLKSGADPNYTPNGVPPLICALLQDWDVTFVGVLIDAGADLESRNSTGNLSNATPIFFAVIYERELTAKLLIDRHADINAVAVYSNNNVTPLDMSLEASGRYSATSEILQLKGALTYLDVLAEQISKQIYRVENKQVKLHYEAELSRIKGIRPTELEYAGHLSPVFYHTLKRYISDLNDLQTQVAETIAQQEAHPAANPAPAGSNPSDLP